MTNKWVLITGASSGIGLELTKLFARDKFNVVLLARSESALRKLAQELSSTHGIETKVLVKDLMSPAAAQETFDALRDTPISILVNNAGLGFYGAFARGNLNEHTSTMQINMTALVQLTHLFLQPMLERGAGRILNVASMAAFQPGPLINVYYATKAFVYSFSYALAIELEGTGVTVTTLCPGTTHTEFFARGRFGNARAPFTMGAATVAEAGYRGLMKGKRMVIPGLMNQLLTRISRLVPDRLNANAVRRIHQLRDRDR